MDNIMKKILIIGCPGSGKTTFSKKLSEKTKIPLVHLDNIFWCGEWKHITREEFDAKLEAELNKDSWIIDGNYDRTLKKRIEFADTVFFFIFPRSLCLWRATKRVIQNYGKTRDDMGGNCVHRFDRNLFSLYKEILSYKKSKSEKYLDLLSQYPNLNIIIFKKKKDINKFVELI